MNDWTAWIGLDESPITTPTPLPDNVVRLTLPNIIIEHAFSVMIHHWENEDWTLVVLCPENMREDFLETWYQNPRQAVNDCPDAFICIAVNRKNQRCWMARDALGFHNAYWAKTANGLCVSSSLKKLNENFVEKPQLEPKHLSEYLSFRYTHAPRTLYKDRFSLIAGHFSIVSKQSTREERWYRPDWYEIGQSIPTEKEALFEVDYLLRRSLEPHLFSNAKMGVLLSGGLDSSAILYHAHELGYQLDSFTVSLEGVEADESPFAGRIAHLYKSNNHLLRLSSNDFIEALRKSVQHFALPIPTPAAAIQAVLCQFSHQWVDRLFTGDGGDEVFGGRSMPTIAKQIRRSKLIHRLPRVSQMGLHRFAKRMNKSEWLASFNQYGLEEEIGGTKVFNAEERASLLQDPAFIRPNIRSNILTNFYQEIDSDPINDILYVWQRGWLIEDSIYRIRKIDPTMIFPMLNRDVREYMARLPSHYKVRAQGLDFHGKWLLRETMNKRMPRRILSRPKRTLMAPMDKWLQTDGRSFLAQHITDMTRIEHDIFLPSTLHKLYREHCNGQVNHGLKLWTLILFHMWYQEHMT